MSNNTPAGGAAPVSPLSGECFGTSAYADHIGARLLDFFADTSPWHRRLWDTGTLLVLDELAEAATWSAAAVLSPGAVSWLAKDVERLAGRDPAVGERELRVQLKDALRGKLVSGSRHHRRLVELTGMIRDGYLDRWLTCIDGPNRPAPERLARALAAHLLDAGYSPRHLHRWTRRLVAGGASLADLFAEASGLACGTDQRFEVLVPFTTVPSAGTALTESQDNWLKPSAAVEWLERHAGDPAGVRQNGAFVYNVMAKDAYAAVALVAGIVERLVSRSSLARGLGTPQPIGRAWLAGHTSAGYDLTTPTRGAFVLSLMAEQRVYEVQERTDLDDALELAAALNHGSPGPAVAGGWAAIEALLVSPTDEADGREGRGATAADRMAALVACSWPRSELTRLAHKHKPTSPDALSVRLKGAETNQERSRIVAEALAGGAQLVVASGSDKAAAARMSKMLAAPRATLGDVRGHVTSAMRRLYRQRNIVMHGGATDAIALASALRTGAPLVGAGLDRIVHAALTDGTDSLTLADRAHVRLQLVGGADGAHVTALLE